MKILITGGAGFIGSQLGFYLLNKGHEVTLLDNLEYGYLDNLLMDGRPFPNFICMNVLDPKLENVMQDKDILFHFAGISSLPECNYNAGKAYQYNVAGTAHVLEMSRRNRVKKIIFSSTSAIYENTEIFPTPEDTEVLPTLIYPLTKKHSEEICKSFRKMYGMDITILRFFNVYGPHMDYLRPNPPLVSYIIKCLLKKEAPLLHSDGKQARDMIYVSDVLEICEIVMTHRNAVDKIFNVGSGVVTSVQEVFEIISKVFGNKKIKPIYRSAKLLWEKYPGLFEGKYKLNNIILEKEVNKYALADTSKAKGKLGWYAKVNIEQGLKQTVDYVKRNHKS